MFFIEVKPSKFANLTNENTCMTSFNQLNSDFILIILGWNEIRPILHNIYP